MGHAVRRYDARAFFVRRSTPALDVGRDGAAHDARLPCAPCPRRSARFAPAHPTLAPAPRPRPPDAITYTHTDTCALSRKHALSHECTHARTHMPTAPVRPHTLITYICAADLPRFHSTHPQSGRINMETYVQRVLRGGRMLGKTKAFSLVKAGSRDVADVDAIARHFDVTIKEVPPSESGFEAEFGSS